MPQEEIPKPSLQPDVLWQLVETHGLDSAVLLELFTRLRSDVPYVPPPEYVGFREYIRLAKKLPN